MASKKNGGKGKMNADKRTMNPVGGPPAGHPMTGLTARPGVRCATRG